MSLKEQLITIIIPRSSSACTSTLHKQNLKILTNRQQKGAFSLRELLFRVQNRGFRGNPTTKMGESEKIGLTKCSSIH